MKLDALLRAHASMKVERPPELWEADTEDARFVPLLTEMIAAPLGHGAAPGDLTLNVSNVVVEASTDGEAAQWGPAPGEYVAVTVSGRADLGPDSRWQPAGSSTPGDLLQRLHGRLLAAGARFAYVRRTPPSGSITVFLRRT